uniref:Short-chain dehydrogenase/reductase 3 n=1 Tax=Nyssomyia neivai TaxID=330878 RepID=A0A1L8E514_9DIPT
MEDIWSLGKLPYEAAKPFKKKSFSENVQGFLQFSLDLLKFLILSIPILAKYLKEIFSPPEMKRVAGQLALVTGGGNGLGKSIAIRLAKEGCNVAIVDVDLEAAQRVAGDIKSFGIKAKAYKVDVSKYQEVKSLSRQVEDDLGPVDILINNAGIMPTISLMEGSPKDIEKILSVNLTSHFWTVRVFLESMIRRRKGHIVAISSLAGIDAAGRAVAYSTSKFGVRGFMEALREEIRLNGNTGEIFTTTAYPYFISTRKDLMDKMEKTSLFQRFPPLIPDDAADIAVDAMLENKESITIPKVWPISRLIFKCLPCRIQDLVREVLVKEYIPRIQL